MATQSWLNRMNRHYIVSNDIYTNVYIYILYNMVHIMYKAVSMCVCEMIGVGLHARSGKRCLQVVRSSWAEEKPPKTTIGSVQRG